MIGRFTGNQNYRYQNTGQTKKCIQCGNILEKTNVQPFGVCWLHELNAKNCCTNPEKDWDGK